MKVRAAIPAQLPCSVDDLGEQGFTHDLESFSLDRNYSGFSHKNTVVEKSVVMHLVVQLQRVEK